MMTSEEFKKLQSGTIIQFEFLNRRIIALVESNHIGLHYICSLYDTNNFYECGTSTAFHIDETPDIEAL